MKQKKILILSFYFTPDLSAGSFRTASLVKSLMEHKDNDLKIDVITTLPNRYATFNSFALEDENSKDLSIHRIKLPSHKSGMRDQARAFCHFALQVWRITRTNKYELVYATSSRLMTAFLGALIARKTRSPLYLDIRDIFADTMNDILPKKISLLCGPLFSLIERFTLKTAFHVNLVSEGFADYFTKRYPQQSFSYFTNGVDEEFISPTRLSPPPQSKVGKIQVLYAGNMGEGQGLHSIIPPLAHSLKDRVEFKLIGDGGKRTHLEKALKLAGIQNVDLLSPISRQALSQEYQKADILFLHLNDFPAFKKVLPSKIFEYAALGKPIWAGIAGYPAEFLKKHVTNSAIFSPCNVNEAIHSLNQLRIQHTDRNEFVSQFLRSTIMGKMAQEILSL